MNIDEFLEKEAELSPQEQKTSNRISLGSAPPARERLQAGISEIKQMIANRKFEEANKKFMLLRDDYYAFLKEQEEEKQMLSKQLTVIHNELIDNLNRLNEDVEKRAEVISRLLLKGEKQLSDNDLQGANNTYFQVREILKAFPDDFHEKKSRLENEALAFYIKLTDKYHASTKSLFMAKSAELSKLISEANFALDLGNRASLEELMGKIRQKYAELPAGFLIEKANFHKQILELNDALQHFDEYGRSTQKTSGMAGKKSEDIFEPKLQTTPISSRSVDKPLKTIDDKKMFPEFPSFPDENTKKSHHEKQDRSSGIERKKSR
ncbi:MAG: hypothetical protein QXK37_00955 [Candidatus Woesearchaeota archaeon]